MSNLLDKIISLWKRRGFIFPGSENLPPHLMKVNNLILRQRRKSSLGVEVYGSFDMIYKS